MTTEKFSFNLLKEGNLARLGKIKTHRGDIDTPAFMPVGTQGTIKSAFIEDVQSTGTQIILSNTYHLMIRPGVERIKKEPAEHKDPATILYPASTYPHKNHLTLIKAFVRLAEKNSEVRLVFTGAPGKAELQVRKEIEKNKEDYEKIIDNAANEIENFVKKINSENLIQ